MTYTISGLASGLDVETLITGLVKVQKQPITAMQADQRNIDLASSTMSSFSSKLAALATAARGLDTSAEFNAMSATSSDTTSVVGSATSSATAGRYDVQVTRLAREQRTNSNTFGSSSLALGLSGSLTIAMGGSSSASATVAVSSTDSLSDIATRISASGLRVSASVIYDGSAYRLSLRGLDTGNNASFSVTESDPSLTADLGLSTPANTVQSAQDAQFTVDGVAMTRATNQATDAIPGVTLALSKVTASPTTITVGTDPAALKTKVQAFVSAYNDIVNTVHSVTGFGSSKATNPELTGDRTMRGALQRLSNIVANTIPGTSGRYTTLSTAGVKLQTDGTLKFDESTFNAAVADDATAVSKLFVTDTRIGATGAMGSFASTVDSLTTAVNAPVRARIDTLGARSRRITDDIDKMQLRIDKYTDDLRLQFSRMDSAVSRYNAQMSAVANIKSITTA